MKHDLLILLCDSSTNEQLELDVSRQDGDDALTTYRNTQASPNCHVVQPDPMKLPSPDEAFDWETNNMVDFDWYHPHNA